MTTPLSTHLRERIASAGTRPALRCESQLRVAANMLSNTHSDEISATTVVGVLGNDDVPAFQALVAEIANERQLDARVRLHVGSFIVCLSRCSTPGPQPSAATASGPASRHVWFPLRTLTRNR